jgi:hypothetical protein
MAKTLYAVPYLGLTAVYGSATGLLDPRTLQPEAGGGLNEGDYFDLSAADLINYPGLFTGRYRFVRIATAATAANIKQGTPAAIATPTTVGTVALVTAGSGQTPGTYTVNSSTSGGTSVAVAQVVIGAAGTITSVKLLQPGAGFTSTPTFTVAAGGTPGTLNAQMAISENVVTSFDGSALSLNNAPRGVFLGSVTAAQIAAGAYVFIQEQGIATVLVTTATATSVGSIAAALTAGAVTTTTGAAGATYVTAQLGNTLDVSAAATLIRVELALPLRQG